MNMMRDSEEIRAHISALIADVIRDLENMRAFSLACAVPLGSDTDRRTLRLSARSITLAAETLAALAGEVRMKLDEQQRFAANRDDVQKVAQMDRLLCATSVVLVIESLERDALFWQRAEGARAQSCARAAADLRSILHIEHETQLSLTLVE